MKGCLVISKLYPKLVYCLYLTCTLFLVSSSLAVFNPNAVLMVLKHLLLGSGDFIFQTVHDPVQLITVPIQPPGQRRGMVAHW